MPRRSALFEKENVYFQFCDVRRVSSPEVLLMGRVGLSGMGTGTASIGSGGSGGGVEEVAMDVEVKDVDGVFRRVGDDADW